MTIHFPDHRDAFDDEDDQRSELGYLLRAMFAVAAVAWIIFVFLLSGQTVLELLKDLLS